MQMCLPSKVLMGNENGSPFNSQLAGMIVDTLKEGRGSRGCEVLKHLT